ncbi:MAG: type II toxin-antitoxin system RelE/ParE family toxin [Burkholderiales bacterium]|jgi:plasmid stabilization system protein ParE|nr:type II toxin-antitoxin system RelE/ParE family toxin [Burkholderiales bacterium]
MKVIWTPEAQQDRVDVWDYIAADNPWAAVRADDLFYEIEGETVWILTLIHTARQWPPVRG